MKINNSRGFSAVEAILVIVLIGLLGGVGYYVYSQNQTEETSESTTNTQQEPTEEETGTLVTSANKAFSVRIPDGWKITNATNEDLITSTATEDDSELTTSNTPAIIAEAEFAGTDELSRFSIQQQPASEFDLSGWISDPDGETTFKLGDLSGKKYKKVYPATTEGLGATPGQTAYLYVFEKDNKVTFVRYNVFKADGTNTKTDDKDQSKLIEEVVSTLTIN